MAVAVGLRLDHYEIIAPLGAGGMGEVYRARDLRLSREVAIKILPADFAKDADRLRRFEQEARATSALNHPNILTVYDFGNYEGNPYLVMELLAGEELRAQLNAGAIAPKRALDYAQQIAAGLAAAHERGVVHRDLKPENLFVTNDGRVKILDFGLAKLKPQKLAGGVDSEAETMKPLTNPGVILGTVGYMSPEQVRGTEVDHRSDIFSFGIILHEVLSGQRTFTGDSMVELMNAILKDEPAELSESNTKISPQLEKLVLHCLEKKPERRFQSVSDLGFALEALALPSSSGANRTEAVPALTSAALPKPSGWRERIAWSAAAALFLGLLAFAWAYFTRPPADTQARKFSVLMPEKVAMIWWEAPVISPDGQRIVFVARDAAGKVSLWLRPLNSLTAQPLTGTEGAMNPFWSPDSQMIGFFTPGKLKKIEATGGTVSSICDVPNGRGGSWNREDVIIFVPGTRSPVMRVSANSGTPVPITKFDDTMQETAHRWPQFLPDGKHFLFFSARPRNANAGVFIGLLDGTQRQRLLDLNTNAVYAAPGYLLFIRERTLMAQPFDAGRRQLSGEPVPIAEPVIHLTNTQANGDLSLFSVSDNGVLAYRNRRDLDPAQLVWVDRMGKQIEAFDPPGDYRDPAISPDGKTVAIDLRDQITGTHDIWLFEVARGVRSRFTSNPAEDMLSNWSSDSSRIAFTSDRTHPSRGKLYVKQVGGTGNEQELADISGGIGSGNWSNDGQYFLYGNQDPNGNFALEIISLSGDKQPRQILDASSNHRVGGFSPDGKWFAYVSNETGAVEVYVQSFPTLDKKVQISKGGGRSPVWRKDGKEIFYVSAERQMMAVAWNGKAEVGNATVLFQVGIEAARSQERFYDVSPDGQRFLLLRPTGEIVSTPFTVVLNWMAEIKK